MSAWQLGIILLICLLAEGYFTGTELAVVNADKLKLKAKANRGSKAARLALQFQSKPGWFFSASLLGTNLALVTASVCTTYFLVENYGKDAEGWAMLLSPILLVFGEIIPKSLYQHYANSLVEKIVYPVRIFSWIFSPVVFLLAKINDLFMGQFSKKIGPRPLVTRDEIEMFMLEESRGGPPERPHHHYTLISKIFGLADKRVSNIMIPLVDVEAVPLRSARAEAFLAFEESQHSRLPVLQGRIVNIVGVLHSFDLLVSEEKQEIRELMRPPFFVPEEMPVDDLLVAMKRKQETMAIVIDEFGGASGVVTFEDVIEEIVGEIHDEYDTVPPSYYRIGKNRFLINGRLEILEANDKLKLGLPMGDYETVAGFLIHQLGRIPDKGTIFHYGPLQFIVHLATEKVVQEIEIRINPPIQ